MIIAGIIMDIFTSSPFLEDSGVTAPPFTLSVFHCSMAFLTTASFRDTATGSRCDDPTVYHTRIPLFHGLPTLLLVSEI